MIRIVRSEWYKLWRRGMVLGGIGTMVAATCLAVILVFANASADATAPPATNGPRERPFLTLAALAAPNGLGLAFGFAAGFIGVISLVLFAQVTGGEYRDGTLKVLLSREPRRLRLLAGKLLAIAAFIVVAVLAAFVAQSLVAVAMAGVRGISTSAWWSGDAIRNVLGVLARTCVSAITRGLLGATLAIAFRAAAPAIGTGIGYTLVGEPLLTLVWPTGRQWLPGAVLDAFVNGGNASLAFARASLMVVAYIALFLVVQGALFRGRDVTG